MTTLWADDLVTEYKQGRQHVTSRKKLLDLSDPADKIDASHMNAMIRDSAEVETWLSAGKDPRTFKGIDKLAIYQKNSWGSMDLIPDIRDELENDGPPPLSLSVEEKGKLRRIFSALSPRERQCYILHNAQRLSMAQIALELNISKATVQMYLKRAKAKVEIRK